jgi:hypothetical protein
MYDRVGVSMRGLGMRGLGAVLIIFGLVLAIYSIPTNLGFVVVGIAGIVVGFLLIRRYS